MKLNSPEPSIWPSLLPPRASLRDYAARGTVTETVVPGDAADVVTRPPSCRVSASTMLVPRPVLDGCVSQACADPHPIIRDRETPRASRRLEAHDDFALGPAWKGVLERIDDKLGGDQAHADGLLGCRRPLAGLDPDRDRLIV